MDKKIKEAFNTGVEMADRFITELEEAFADLEDEEMLFALAGGGCWQQRWMASPLSKAGIRMRPVG